MQIGKEEFIRGALNVGKQNNMVSCLLQLFLGINRNAFRCDNKWECFKFAQLFRLVGTLLMWKVSEKIRSSH